MDRPGTEYRVGLVGARVRCAPRDREFVWSLVERLQQKFPNVTIVSGGAKSGADAFAKEASSHFGTGYIEHPVKGQFKNKWEFRKAAHSRNTLIAQDALDCLFALVQVPRKGGTEDTVTKYQNFIIDGDTRRRLYLVFPDLSIERWTPIVKQLSEWEIDGWNGHVSRRS